MAKIISTKETQHSATQQRLKKLLIGLVAAVVLASSIFGGVKIWQAQTAPKPETSDQRIARLRRQASATIGQDQTQLINDYSKAIQSESDMNAKQQLLWGKAYTEMQSGKLDQALTDALNADKLLRSAETVGLIAAIYRQQKNTSKAIEYYRLQLDLLPKDSETNIDENDIKYKIAQLEAAK
ncbi:hypothetical protein KA093_00600 [Candidatus Saccharibacteria bacterium]|nr:hypothetical protein [Candidatus Saccharibacteria bacterium]